LIKDATGIGTVALLCLAVRPIFLPIIVIAMGHDRQLRLARKPA
jgi:hypothetical protein